MEEGDRRISLEKEFQSFGARMAKKALSGVAIHITSEGGGTQSQSCQWGGG